MRVYTSMHDEEAAAPHEPAIDPDATADERNYAKWTHLGPLIAGVLVVVTQGVAFFVPAVVALALWFSRRNESPYLDDHGREALNFQISLVIWALVVLVGGFVTFGIAWIVGAPMYIVLALVGMLRAVGAASRGEYYRYPCTFRFV